MLAAMLASIEAAVLASVEAAVLASVDAAVLAAREASVLASAFAAPSLAAVPTKKDLAGLLLQGLLLCGSG